MARPATGNAFIEAAKAQIASARSVDALRAAQALLLPLEFGLSLEQTAIVVGLSKSQTTKIRTRFQRVEMGTEPPKAEQRRRNHARMTLAEEASLLASFSDKGEPPGTNVASTLRAEMERHLGHSVALSTVYRLLHRHGWRKLAPKSIS